MARKKKRKSGNKTTFNNILKETGSHEAIKIDQNKVNDTQTSRLEKALEGIQVVDHKPIYRNVESELKRYKNTEEHTPGYGLTRDFLETMYLGIRQGLEFILHVTKDAGLPELRKFLKNDEYRGTMDARIEYIDALISLSHSAALEQKEKKRNPKGKNTYNQSEISYWNTVKEKLKTAKKYQDKTAEEPTRVNQALIELKESDPKYGKKRSRIMREKRDYKQPFETALSEAYRAAGQFNKATFKLANEGIALLFP